MCNFDSVIDKAIQETVTAFLSNPWQFHGDTAIMQYLFHRALANDNNDEFWHSTNGGPRTLLLRSEHPTTLRYRESGRRESYGRLDFAVLDKKAVPENGIVSNDADAVVGIEVGRNKKFKRMGDIAADASAARVRPGDAAKVIRELRYAKMKRGYLLEFFDRPEDLELARSLFERIRDSWEELSQTDGRHDNCLRLLVAAKWLDEERAVVNVVETYPPVWKESTSLCLKKFQGLPDPPREREHFINSYEQFKQKCGTCNQMLQSQFYATLRSCATWGPSQSMTIRHPTENRRLLLRVTHAEGGDERIVEIADCVRVALSEEGIDVVDILRFPREENDHEGFVRTIVHALTNVI